MNLDDLDHPSDRHAAVKGALRRRFAAIGVEVDSDDPLGDGLRVAGLDFYREDFRELCEAIETDADVAEECS